MMLFCFQLRIMTRAKEIDGKLKLHSDMIGTINTRGIVSGFKSKSIP